MKIVERIKKGLIGLGAFLLTIPTKVFAVGIDLDRTPTLYGMLEPNPEPESLILKNILNICRIAVIPLALIIGIVIYLKKSKSSQKRKIKWHIPYPVQAVRSAPLPPETTAVPSDCRTRRRPGSAPVRPAPDRQSTRREPSRRGTSATRPAPPARRTAQCGGC